MAARETNMAAEKYELALDVMHRQAMILSTAQKYSLYGRDRGVNR